MELYEGSFLTGGSGGYYSYVHSANKNPMTPSNGYTQYAGGQVHFAIDNRDSFQFTFTDNGAAGLSAGDLLSFNINVDLLNFDGSFNGTNDDLTVIGAMSLQGTFTVGDTTDPHSSSFTNAISNISLAESPANGLSYGINLNEHASSFANDNFAGDAFFQAAAFAGPFNGISYDATTKTIDFALWGDSRSPTQNTGKLNDSDHALGFDFRVRASFIPEPTTAMTFAIFSCGFFGLNWRRRDES